MFLYDYIFYVIYKFLGTLTLVQGGTTSNIYYIYPTRAGTYIGDIELSRTVKTLYTAWDSLPRDVSWLNNFFNDPRLLISTLLYILCVVVTVQLCFILPFRWFKRLVKYPNARLQTPNEVRRMRRK